VNQLPKRNETEAACHCRGVPALYNLVALGRNLYSVPLGYLPMVKAPLVDMRGNPSDLKPSLDMNNIGAIEAARSQSSVSPNSAQNH
jgi:hypothetical protein